VPSLVKPLAAGPGDHVCVTDHLAISGQTIAPVLDAGPDGVPLPRWRECRVLAADEWFAYAPRIPNSLDSRYYGPVKAADITGVFKPVWTSGN
jgi:type IV secretory pathway protease TraF